MMTTLDTLYQRYKKLLLNKKETAASLNISTTTLDRLRNQGLIKSKKFRGCVYFTLDEIASFIGE